MENNIFDEQRCRICGCTWDNACLGGCYWIEEDLCSDCKEVAMIKKQKNVLLSTFKPLDDEDEGIDERFYEFIDEETLNKFLNLTNS